MLATSLSKHRTRSHSSESCRETSAFVSTDAWKKIYFFLSPWNPSKWTNRALRKIMTKSIAHIPPSMTQHTTKKVDVCAPINAPVSLLKLTRLLPSPNKRKSTFLSLQVKAELLWEGHRLVRSVASRVRQRPTHLYASLISEPFPEALGVSHTQVLSWLYVA